MDYTPETGETFVKVTQLRYSILLDIENSYRVCSIKLNAALSTAEALSAESRELKSELSTLREDHVDLQTKNRALLGELDEAHNKLVDANKQVEWLGARHSPLKKYIDEILTSSVFRNRIEEACVNTVEYVLASPEFAKQTQDQITEFVDNTDIDVSDAVDKAIQETLERVQIRFDGR